VNETHNFWCEKCNKKVTLEAANRSEAQGIMRKSGWSLRIGGVRGMVVGLWTCPECQGKEVEK
jgi:transcription initiation factor IIE alpha subunit